MTEPSAATPAQVEFTVARRRHGGRRSPTGSTEQGFLGDARAFVFIATDRELADKLEAGTFILRKNMTPDELVTALLVAKDLAVVDRAPRGPPARADHGQAPDAAADDGRQGVLRRGRRTRRRRCSPTTRGSTCPKGASLEGFLAPATYRVLPDIDPGRARPADARPVPRDGRRRSG